MFVTRRSILNPDCVLLSWNSRLNSMMMDAIFLSCCLVIVKYSNSVVYWRVTNSVWNSGGWEREFNHVECSYLCMIAVDEFHNWGCLHELLLMWYGCDAFRKCILVSSQFSQEFELFSSYFEVINKISLRFNLLNITFFIIMFLSDPMS